MLGVLQQINSVPGVVGSFICDSDGILIDRVFPPLFDAALLEDVASTIADSALAMEDFTGGIDQLDLRFNESRIVVKTLAQSYLFLLCTKEINLQLLLMSLNVAVKKLDRLIANRQTLPKPVPAPATQVKAAAAVILPAVDRGLGLTAHLQKNTSGSYWDNMLETVAVNRFTAVQLSDHYKTSSFKKLKLTNRTNGTSKKFTVRIIKDDNEHMFDGKAVISLAVMEALGVKQDEIIKAEIDIGGGFLGWEGI